MNISDIGLPKCWGGGSFQLPKTEEGNPGKFGPPHVGLQPPHQHQPGHPGAPHVPKNPQDQCDIRPTEEPAGKLPDLSAAFG